MVGGGPGIGGRSRRRHLWKDRDGVTARETLRRMAGMTSPDRAGADSALPTWGASGNVTFHLDVHTYARNTGGVGGWGWGFVQKGKCIYLLD